MCELTRDPAAMAACLRDAGCPESFVRAYLDAAGRGAEEEQLSLLAQQRGCLLERVHDVQRKLDCLDELRCGLKKQAGR